MFVIVRALQRTSTPAVILEWVSTMIRTFVSIASVATLTAAAHAQQPPSSAPATPSEKIVVTGKAAGKAKMVCERTIETGSLMPSKICRTQEKWDELHQSAMDNLERVRSNRTLVSMQQDGK